MNTLAGYCFKCGSPIYMPEQWNAITPPPATYTCQCFSYERKPVGIPVKKEEEHGIVTL